MKELYYHYVKIRKEEPGYKEGELLYHHIRIKDDNNCVGDYCSICKKQFYRNKNGD